MMRQINRIRPEASIMKTLHPMTGHKVEGSEDTGMVAGKETISFFQEKADGEEDQDEGG